ncbi:MAG: hypothetical protein WAL50_22900 [Kineosporiaceae bacterium]
MTVRDRRPVRDTRAAVIGAMIIGLAAGTLTACSVSGEPSVATRTVAASAGTSVPSAAASSPGGTTAPTTEVTADEVAKVARTRVFFGHQSVGMNILEGVPGVYSALGVAAPPITEGEAAAGAAGGFVTHAFIGRNEKPLLKIDDFSARLRAGLGTQVDVAMMKFCYVDVYGDRDVDALFARYRDTMTALERDLPKVTFIKVTVPLTTRGSGAQADNATRERLNALIRREYTGHHLFDLAAVESTAPDGTRAASPFEGQESFALFDGYAADEGHLNATGARRVASAWLKAIAEASPK